jgi:hypothetical protein
MKRESILGVGSIVLLAAIPLSRAAEIPFKYVAVDDGVKNPWAKIVADIDRDGFLDLLAARRGLWSGIATPIGRRP